VRGKTFATLLGSAQNINPTLSRRNLPLSIYHDTTSKHVQDIYQDVDFVGYTCIESDYLYRGFSGKLAVGDYVVFSNVGSYSLVLKPPFILPNFAVVEYDTRYGSIELVRENETFEDVFRTFKF
jgi:diaminopimelate decarboxylase